MLSISHSDYWISIQGSATCRVNGYIRHVIVYLLYYITRPMAGLYLLCNVIVVIIVIVNSLFGWSYCCTIRTARGNVIVT